MTSSGTIAVLGFFIPLLTAGAVRFHWSSGTKGIITLVLTVVAAVATQAFSTSSFSFSMVVRDWVPIAATAETLYLMVFKPLGWTNYIQENWGNTLPKQP